MTSSRKYQIELVSALSRFFPGSVEMEYYIPEKKKDLLAQQKDIYLPRLDVIVGKDGDEPGNQFEKVKALYFSKAPQSLRDITDNLAKNENPRCSLGIEVVYSGTSKHILGDIVNSGTLGLYGLVLASDAMYDKVQRIHRYIKTVKGIGKMPVELCLNVEVLRAREFLDTITAAT